MPDKPLLARLLLKPGVTLAWIGAPKDVTPPEETKLVARGPAEAVLLFARDLAALDATFEKARARLAIGGRFWVAYPKGGKLSTDLNRDSLARAVEERELEPVRQVSLDETWSALWFKPK